MNDKLVENMMNPVKFKIYLEIRTQGQATAKGLAQKNLNIPQATLYRYLKKMVSDGIIRVAEERQVRNVTEKVYELTTDPENNIEKIVQENSGEGYLRLFQQFMMGLFQEFHEYAEKENIDIVKDASGFSMRPFYASGEEMQELGMKIHEVMKPFYESQPSPNRQMRSLAMIFTPPKDGILDE